MNEVLKRISELGDTVQNMRENGDTDLRTVLHHISGTAYDIRKYLSDKEITEKGRLSEAEGLLYDAKDLLDNVHCYGTEIFDKIGKFLYGEDE